LRDLFLGEILLKRSYWTKIRNSQANFSFKFSTKKTFFKILISSIIQKELLLFLSSNSIFQVFSAQKLFPPFSRHLFQQDDEKKSQNKHQSKIQEAWTKRTPQVSHSIFF